MAGRLSGWQRLGYALGTTGFQLSDRIVVAISLYFYLPPGGRGLEAQVPIGVFALGLTAYGLAMMAGRFVDMFFDPLVGFASDRSRSRFGRRRTFMMAGVVPLVTLPVLLFWPPGPPGSMLNVYWLASLSILYFCAFSVYVAPYLALISEIARDEQERVQLAATVAAASFPVLAVFGSAWGVGLDWGRVAGFTPLESIRAIVVIASVIALVLCILPIVVIDEKQFQTTEPSSLSLREAVTATFGNRAFRRYILAQLPFILGINMIGPALVYYATVVFGRSEGFSLYLGLAMVLPTVIGFRVVQSLTARLGPKRTMMLCTASFSAAMAALWGLQPDQPGGLHDQANLWLAFSVLTFNGVPLAGFFVLPSVFVSQCVDWDEARTGSNRAAIYFGLQGFITKVPYGISGAILAYLLQSYGASTEAPLGVLLVGPVAGIFCLLSALTFALYPESQLLAETREMRAREEQEGGGHAGRRARPPSISH